MESRKWVESLCRTFLDWACRARYSIDIAELHLVKTRVHTAAREKFLVRASLTDCAAFQHSNQVCAANS
jgi:protein subunit release factor B